MTPARPDGVTPSAPLTSGLTSRRRVLGLAGALAGAVVAAPAAALLGPAATPAAAADADEPATEPVDQEFECLADLIEAGEVSRADLLAG